MIIIEVKSLFFLRVSTSLNGFRCLDSPCEFPWVVSWNTETSTTPRTNKKVKINLNTEDGGFWGWTFIDGGGGRLMSTCSCRGRLSRTLGLDSDNNK